MLRIASTACVYKLQPPATIFGATIEQTEEGLLQCASDRAGCPVANFPPIDRAHRRDLGGGPGHEDLVGAVQRLAGQVALFHAQSEVASQRDHRVAGDAGQDAGAARRGQQLALLDQKQVLAGAFAQQPGGGQGDAFAIAVAARLARDPSRAGSLGQRWRCR